MSKLIVEMEMSRKNRFCGLQCADLYCIKTSKKCNVFDTGERPPWCPIKGVLPEEHGDLIDRDELLKECYPDDEFDAHIIYADDIQKAKAVIAAERKESV